MMKGLVFAGRYKLEDFIGQGGMSLVYRAVDIRTGHSVAVKILKSEYNSDKEFLERFQREAQAASLMSHHNIVNLLDVGVEGEYRYLVLEYVSGNTLKDIIRQKGRLNTNTAIQIAIRILSALQHAHDNGIIHRDIKPQNILVNSDGHIKVADFGIARMTNAFTINKGDTVVGSVHYSSPEQTMGSVTEATSDIYSTGVVMFEMLTGHVPFVGDSPIAVAMQHINKTPPPILDYAPETPPMVVAVVMKALEKDPHNRFQTARDMADALIKARDSKLDPLALEPIEGIAGTQTVKRVSELSPRTSTNRNHPIRKPAPNAYRRRKKLLLTSLVVVCVLMLLALGVIHVYTSVSQSAVAPDVRGLSVSEAVALAKREGLNWQQNSINHESIPADMVISQIPEPDTQMRKGDSLLVTVSLGPVNVLMIDVTGKTCEEATARLKERGFDNIYLYTTVSTEKPGTVLKQDPIPGQVLPLEQRVNLTLSGGSVLVPDVSNLTLEEAKSKLSGAELTADPLVYAEVGNAELVGRIVAQNPGANTMAMLGAAVELTIGVERLPYTADISFYTLASDKDRQVRVALVIDGVEEVKKECLLEANVTDIRIPITSSVQGDFLYRIYLDDVLCEEKAVTLK